MRTRMSAALKAIRDNSLVSGSVVLLVVMIAILIWLNHTSNTERNRNAQEEFKDDARKIASLIDYFLYERVNDIKNLSDSRQVLTYFENEALGMSVAYGLLASRMGIDDEFSRLIQDRRIGNVLIYSRLTLFDMDGNIIADIPARGGGNQGTAPGPSGLERFTGDDGQPGFIQVDFSAEPARIILRHPVLVNNRQAGHLVAVLDFASLLTPLVNAPQLHNHRVLCIAAPKGPVAYLYGGDRFDLGPLSPGLAPAADFAKVPFPPGIARTPDVAGLYIVVRARVGETPLSVISAIQANELLGTIPPWFTTSVITLLCLIIFAAILMLINSNYKQLALERLKLLFENAGDAIYLTDSSGRLLEVNQEAEHQTGFTRGELLGKSLTDLDPDLSKEGMAALAGQLSRQPRATMEARHLRKDGSSFPVGLSMVCLESEGRDFLLSIARDISERKRFEAAMIEAKEQAESASLAKSEFLANMSHEIRTPMTGVLGMLQLLETTPLDDEQKEYVLAAIKSSRRMTQLLVDILDLSRVEAGKLMIQEAPFEIRKMKESVLELFADAASQKGLDFDFRIDARVPPMLAGDETRLRQILFNIVGNAVKFTTAGRILIGVSLLNGQAGAACKLLFTVEDSGIGIPDDLLKVVFEPFVQGVNTRRRDFQGAGLGLSIVRRLVALMGGDLCIDNTESSGTTFYISLPFSVPPAAPAEAEGAKLGPEPPSPASPAILLAEDELVNAIAISRLLAKSGYGVTRAVNGLEALKLLSEQDFDLVLMDIQMPIMDGMEATRTIRTAKEYEAKAKIPIIAMTAYAMTGDREKFLAAGMDDYISKPVDIAVLKEIIARAMSGRRAP